MGTLQLVRPPGSPGTPKPHDEAGEDRAALSLAVPHHGGTRLRPEVESGIGGGPVTVGESGVQHEEPHPGGGRLNPHHHHGMAVRLPGEAVEEQDRVPPAEVALHEAPEPGGLRLCGEGLDYALSTPGRGKVGESLDQLGHREPPGE